MNILKTILNKKINTMPSNNVGEYYLKYLKAWYGFFIKLYYKYIAYYCMIKISNLNKGSRILDIGCGIGILVHQFNKLGYQALGIDISQEAILCSLEPLNCIHVEKSSELPFPDHYFDLVVSREVLEHISAFDIDTCIDEWERVGKETFIHIIAVSDRGERVINDPAHLNVQSEDWWIKKFNEHNYRVIKKPSKVYFYPYGSNGYFMTIKNHKKK